MYASRNAVRRIMARVYPPFTIGWTGGISDRRSSSTYRLWSRSAAASGAVMCPPLRSGSRSIPAPVFRCKEARPLQGGSALPGRRALPSRELRTRRPGRRMVGVLVGDPERSRERACPLWTLSNDIGELHDEVNGLRADIRSKTRAARSTNAAVQGRSLLAFLASALIMTSRDVLDPDRHRLADGHLS